MQAPLSKLVHVKPYQTGSNGQLPPPSPPPPPPQPATGLAPLLGIARRHALVIVGVAATFFGYSVWKTLNQTTLYRGDFQILVEPVNVDNANLAAPTESSGNGNRSAALDYPTQIAILKSPELLGTVAEDLQLDYGTLSNQLDISRLGETKLLQISYQSDKATQTQAVLDALAATYLEYSLSERQTYLRQGLQFVEGQIETLQKRLNELQNRLERFQQQNNFVDPAVRSTQITDNMATLAQQQQELEQALATLRSQKNILEQDQGMQVALEQASAYQTILNQIQAIDAQIATELTRFRPENLAIKTLEKQRENLLPLLEQQAQQFLDTRVADVSIQQQTVETQLRSVRENQTELQDQIQVLPTINREYGNLQKELEITNASLTSLLEAQQKLQIEAAQQELPWELVKEPVAQAIPSDVAKSILTALLTGIALGGGVAFALDKLDNTYHTPEELKHDVRLPMLGLLPFNQQLFLNEGIGATGQQRRRKLLSRLRLLAIKASAKVSKSMSFIALSLLDEYDSSAEFVEALRVMHANLQMSEASGPIGVVTISSTTPGDGKSTLALNWAQTAVSMGQRVLLIDAVLRSPQLHRVLQLSNHIGLSDLLSQDLKPAEAIQPVHPDGKLCAVTAGQSVENPASLLSSPKMQQLLAHYRHSFDLVIIDTPSISGLADATIVNRHTDGMVLVVRLDQTTKASLRPALENLQSLKTPLLGMVVNAYKGHNTALREAFLSSESATESSEQVEDVFAEPESGIENNASDPVETTTPSAR